MTASILPAGITIGCGAGAGALALEFDELSLGLEFDAAGVPFLLHPLTASKNAASNKNTLRFRISSLLNDL
ncbi:MAG TPA: hypothetical protein VJR23_00950 [Candidatus Acidoferrales bacterium]|nr:hypothetical protein [Candidatus Acidoferrales bacterium]